MIVWRIKNISIGRYNKLHYAGIILLVAVLVGELVAKAVIVWRLGISRWTYDTYYVQDENLNRLMWSSKFSPHPYFGYESPAIRSNEIMVKAVVSRIISDEKSSRPRASS